MYDCSDIYIHIYQITNYAIDLPYLHHQRNFLSYDLSYYLLCITVHNNGKLN